MGFMIFLFCCVEVEIGGDMSVLGDYYGEGRAEPWLFEETGQGS